MGLYAVVVPEATTNLVTNPSFETGTTGWTAGTGALAQISTYAVYGQYSGRYTPGAGTTDGCYYAITLVAATAYAIQAMVRGAVGIPYKLYLYDPAGGGTVIGTTTFTGTGDWQLVELLATTNGATAFRIYVAKNGSADTTAIYIDGVQCEAKAYRTTYVDGDQAGGSWSGTKHASTSARSAQSRAGGKIVNFEDYDGVFVERSTGMGMPPIANNVLDMAVLPGSIYQNSKALNRSIILVISANGSSRANLHALRQTLIDLFKPDAVAPADQAVSLRYTGSGRTLRCSVRYDGGLDMSTVDGFHESIMLRLVAVDPFFYDEFPQSIALAATEAALTVHNIVARRSGVWSNLGAPALTGVLASTLAVAYDKVRNRLYVGGDWTDLDGQANCDKIAYYDFATATWHPLQTGLNGTVYSLVLAVDGTLYVAGVFTDAGGDANADYVAKYNPTTNTFATVGAGGPNNFCYGLAIGPTNGYLYVVGAFAAPGEKVCYWNGAAWAAMSTGLVGGAQGNDIQIDAANGYIWATGDFTDYVKFWNGSAWATPGGAALSGGILGGKSIAIAPGSVVYVGGDFDLPFANLVKWNGSTWVNIGEPNNNVYSVRWVDGTLYIGGQFSSISGRAIDPTAIAQWNGTTWASFDVKLPGSHVYCFCTDGTGGLYVGGDSYAAATAPGGTSISVVTGSARAYPVFTIKRSGGTTATVNWLENITSGDKLAMAIPLLDGESLTIDLTPRQKAFKTTVRGNVLGLVNPISNLATWCLLPGSNTVNALVQTTGSPTVVPTMAWTNTYWSADSD